MTVTEQLKQASSREIGQITSHPWLTAAADGVLQDHQVGAWAAQDLLWGAWYGEVMPAARKQAPPSAQEAFGWLDANMDRELGWLRGLAGGYPQPPGCDRIWPAFLGYAAWAQVVARRGPVQALTVAWACEDAYHEAWSMVRDRRPEQPWVRWAAAENWGSPAFARMMAELAAGLDAAAAAGSVRPGELAEIARQTYAWEALCWTDVYECRGWQR
jgi:thiaminase